MPALNLKGMDINALMTLRLKIDGELGARRAELQKKIATLDKAVAAKNGQGRRAGLARNGRRTGSARPSPLTGRKVAPKYRDRAGNTWAGRGVQPNWLTAAVKSGGKLEDFLIKKTGPSKAQTRTKKPKRK